MKKQTNAPTYGWESAAVRAALENKGWLWMSIAGRGGHNGFSDWYPPRIARYILNHLREAGSCSATNEWAHQVTVCGPGGQPGRFGCYYPAKMLGLFYGLHCYHKKQNRQLRREVKRSERRAHEARLLLFLAGYKPDGKGGLVEHHAK